MNNPAYSALTSVFERVARLAAAKKILFWESRTMMPPGGSDSRGKILATLGTVMAETIATHQVGEWLDRAESRELSGLGEWDAANLREMRRKWILATAIPPELIGAITEESSRTQAAWSDAKRNNDFKSFAPPLRALMKLQLEALAIKSKALGLAPYDTLLEEYEPGMRMAAIDPMFDDLALFLPGLLEKITHKQNASPAPLALPGSFSDEQQFKFAQALAAQTGFDFAHGRLDKSAHPFTSGVPGDVRITTRFNPNDVRGSVIATIHETGHAMYESGLPAQWAFQPVGEARGASVHESQSLIFEMQAGRSTPFVRHLAKLLRESYGDATAPWSDENILKLYRRTEPSFIRVDADEITYPLHVILRYRLERAIVDGMLEVADIPEAWNAQSKNLLGIVPPTDTLGCLQDLHWAIGLFGYFPTYTLGAMTAAQLFAQARKDEPDLLAKLAKGDYSALLSWTREHIHSQGSFYATSNALLNRATGEPLSTRAFKAHLTERYLENPPA